MTRSRRFFASSPWIATGTPDYVNLGYTSRGIAKQALMRLSRKSLAIFRKLGLDAERPIAQAQRQLDHGNPHAARVLFEKALQVDPNQWESHAYLAEMHLDAGDMAAAYST